tara:strand:- start:291 stop:3857 length:3567 start_codon:yes stop_codon:yes gene_type:complete
MLNQTYINNIFNYLVIFLTKLYQHFLVYINQNNMKRTKTTSLVVVLLLVFASPIFGQSRKSDIIQYYILFDNSGSVHSIDTQKNLQKMAEAFISTEGVFNKSKTINNKNKIKVRFSLFGDSTNKLSKPIFIDYEKGETEFKSQLGKLKDILEPEMKRTSEIKYSDLKASLEIVLETLNNNSNNISVPSSGIIIFTDGVLLNGDLPIGTDYWNYRKELESLMVRIEGLHSAPIFFVSTNGAIEDRNNFVDGTRFEDIMTEQPKSGFGLGKRSFWMDSALDYDDFLKDSDLKYNFRKFQGLVSTTIMNFGYYPAKPGDKIYAAIKVQELIELRSSSLLKEDIDKLIDSDLTDSTKYPLIELMCLLSFYNTKQSLSALPFDYNEVDILLTELSKSPEDITELIRKVKIKADSIIYSIPKKASPAPSDKTTKDNQPTHEENEKLKKSVEKLIEKSVEYSVLSWQALQPVSTFSLSDVDIIATSANLESDLIQGFNDYLVERSKLEVIYSLFENMKSGLDKLKMDSLFPKTWKLLEDPNNYHDFAIIHTAFKTDLDNLPHFLVDKHKDKLMESPEFIGLYYTVNLIQQLMKGQDLESAFKKLGENNSRIFQESTTLGSLKNDSKKLAFVTEQYIRLTLNLLSKKDYDFSKIYTADSLAVRELTIMINSMTLNDIDAKALDIKNIYDNGKDNLTKLFEQYDQLKLELENLQKLINKIPEADFKDFQEYRYTVVLDVFQRIANLFLKSREIFSDIGPVAELKIDSTRIDKVFSSLIEINEFYFLLRKKDYQKAIFIAAPYLSYYLIENFDYTILQDSLLKDKKNIKRKVLQIGASPEEIDTLVVKKLNKWRTTDLDAEQENAIEELNKEYKDLNLSVNNLKVRQNKLSVNLNGQLKNLIKSQYPHDSINIKKGLESWKYQRISNSRQAKKLFQNEFGINSGFLGRWNFEKVNEEKNNTVYKLSDNYIARLNYRLSVNRLFAKDSLNKHNLRLYTFKTLKDSAKKGNLPAGFDIEKDLYFNNSLFQSRIHQVLKVGSQIASVKSSEEVKNLLAKTALPVGSYRHKRQQRTSLMVSAYPGLGVILLDGRDFKFGLIAPVGVELNLGKRNILFGNRGAFQSISLMASVFDVGNVINYNPEKGEQPDFRFGGIFSPGLTTSFGINSKLPLNFNIGYMLVPERFTVSVALDLPLFNIKIN